VLELAAEGNVSKLKLSEDQQDVLDAMLGFASGEHDGADNLMTVGGYAGTGKSTLLGLFAEQMQKNGVCPAYVTPTGRAASVLRKKLAACGVKTTKARGEQGTPFCHTIHGLTKFPTVNNRGELMGFEPAPSVVGYDLLVIDEASMVGGEMLRHLQSFNLPILAVGDHGQLPPVLDSAGLMDNPDMRLEKIHRQAADNPIIALSARVRETGELDRSLEDGVRLRFMNRRAGRQAIAEQLRDKKISPFDKAIICAYNRTRVELNRFARDVLELTTSPVYPKKDDLIICLKNLHLLGIMNGMRGVMLEDASQDEKTEWQITGSMRFPDEDLEIDGEWLLTKVGGMCWPGFMREKPFATVEEFNKEVVQMFPKLGRADGSDYPAHHMNMLGWPFDFGYAMTAHKCVHPETLVETPQGLMFAGELPARGVVATPTGRATFCERVEYGSDSMLEIVTRDGYGLRVTPEHGVDVYRSEKYVRVTARDVRPGDLVRLRLGAEFGWQSKQPLPRIAAGALDVRAKRFRTPTLLNAEVAEFLGLMVADGTVYCSGFRLAKRHKDVADRFAWLCKTLFGVETKRFKKRGAHFVEVSSTHIVSWLRAVGGMQPRAKDVPAVVLRSRLSIQAAFLRGLFEDGTVNLKKGKLDHIEWSSAYEPLRRKVRVMLLRLEIISGATPKRPESVYIYGVHAKRFAASVGFVARAKNERLEASVGEERKYIVPTALGQVSPGSKIKRVSRAKARELGLREELRFHHSFVREIKKMRAPSICIEVPRGHQFIQDGFCGWNSQGSQFSRVAVWHDRRPEPESEDYRRWLYTAITRASERLLVIE
jgi:hypothetical protein